MRGHVYVIPCLYTCISYHAPSATDNLQSRACDGTLAVGGWAPDTTGAGTGVLDIAVSGLNVDINWCPGHCCLWSQHWHQLVSWIVVSLVSMLTSTGVLVLMLTSNGVLDIAVAVSDVNLDISWCQ